MLLWGIDKQRGGRGMKREGEIASARVESSVHIFLGGVRNRECVQQNLVYGNLLPA